MFAMLAGIAVYHAQRMQEKLKMQQTQRPIVTSTVWFNAKGGDYKKGQQPNAAMVTFVQPDALGPFPTRVNLAVFYEHGGRKGEVNVPFYCGEGERPIFPYCEWPHD